MLRCPSCGAPAAPDAGRCVYCQSRLATIGCPVCMALLFEGAAFCPSCGAARSRSEEAERQTTKCPGCRGDMTWVRIGEVDLLECTSCDGTWIEAAAFERLCAQREHQAAVLQRKPTEVKIGPQSVKERVRYRPCPQCRKMMNRLNFGRLSGAILDVCKQHGTFLDRGELHQVVQFILDGGLDRTPRGRGRYSEGRTTAPARADFTVEPIENLIRTQRFWVHGRADHLRQGCGGPP
jgi:Zn-finger nucleic acid-binding protein